MPAGFVCAKAVLLPRSRPAVKSEAVENLEKELP
jgi:hypothetical protein